jgi:hypothetical protein
MRQTDGNTAGERVRYFIVGTGRCGTSMLAKTIERAGGDFSNMLREAGKGRSGYFESNRLNLALKWYRRAQVLQDPVPDFIRRFCTRRGSRHLRAELQKARWHKSPHFHDHIFQIKRLGYEPVIIAAWRDFGPTAVSYHRKNGTSADFEMERWTRVNFNLLFLLDVYPGCLVKFEDFVNRRSDAWAREINRVSGLHIDDLLQARERVLDNRSHPLSEVDESILPEQMRALHRSLMKRTFGRFPPSDSA